MSYIIGSLTLPSEPLSVKPRRKMMVSKVPLYTIKPMIIRMGPDVPVLTVSGFFSGDTIENLYINYVTPLTNMIDRPIGSPVIHLDENPVAFGWAAYTEGVGNYTFAVSDSATQYKTGTESLRIVTTNAGAMNFADGGTWIDYSATPWNLSSHDFISFHFYNSASTDQWTCDLSSPGGGNYFRKTFNDSGAPGWSRHVYRKDQFTVAGLADWASIAYIHFHTINASGATRINYVDRVCAGTGVLVDFPGTRYDGLYKLTDFQFEEKGGVMRTIYYTLELTQDDQFYGSA